MSNLDPETLEELPEGEAGLILIGGIQVMAGYLHDQEKTKNAIVETDGIRWYKTGDKGKLDEDGFLTILDRYSRFAKIGGEMISLGAIEESIAKIIAGEETEIAAVALPDEKKGEKVILLVSGEIDLAGLKQNLTEKKMNPLMIPADFIKVDTIPKLGGNKKRHDELFNSEGIFYRCGVVVIRLILQQSLAELF